MVGCGPCVVVVVVVVVAAVGFSSEGTGIAPDEEGIEIELEDLSIWNFLELQSSLAVGAYGVSYSIVAGLPAVQIFSTTTRKGHDTSKEFTKPLPLYHKQTVSTTAGSALLSCLSFGDTRPPSNPANPLSVGASRRRTNPRSHTKTANRLSNSRPRKPGTSGPSAVDDRVRWLASRNSHLPKVAAGYAEYLLF